ncbi:MAG TPA: hypothetical protein VGN72_07690 [Tepidisphaeraceae bacterium]|nr:hypothetical protein [Tepidisphaeraceae bacterium]
MSTVLAAAARRKPCNAVTFSPDLSERSYPLQLRFPNVRSVFEKLDGIERTATGYRVAGKVEIDAGLGVRTRREAYELAIRVQFDPPGYVAAMLDHGMPGVRVIAINAKTLPIVFEIGEGNVVVPLWPLDEYDWPVMPNGKTVLSVEQALRRTGDADGGDRLRDLFRSTFSELLTDYVNDAARVEIGGGR